MLDFSTNIKRNYKRLICKNAISNSTENSSVLSPKGKDLIYNKEKSCVVYTFECCCSNSYIGQTS